MRNSTPFFFLFLNLLLAGALAATYTATVTSTQIIEGVNVSLNSTTGLLEYTNTGKTNVLTCSGPVGDTMDIKVVSAQDDGTTLSDTITVNFGAPVYSFPISTVGWLPRNGGMAIVRAYAQFANSLKDQGNLLSAIYNSETVLPPGFPGPIPNQTPSSSRKRSTHDEEEDVTDYVKEGDVFLYLNDPEYLSNPLKKSSAAKPGKRGEKVIKKEVKITGPIGERLALNNALREGRFTNTQKKNKNSKRNKGEVTKEEIEVEMYHKYLRALWKKGDEEIIVPDDHLIYSVDGHWKTAAELTPKQRFNLRVGGKTTNVLHSILANEVLRDKLYSYIDHTAALRGDTNHLEGLKAFLEKTEPNGNKRGKRYWHAAADGQPDLQTIYQNGVTGFPGVADALNDNKVACKDLVPNLDIDNAAACTLAIEGTIYTQLESFKSILLQIENILGLSLDASGHLVQAANGLLALINNLQAQETETQKQITGIANTESNLVTLVGSQTYANSVMSATIQNVNYNAQAAAFATSTNVNILAQALNGQILVAQQATVSLQSEIGSIQQLFLATQDRVSQQILAQVGASISQVISSQNLGFSDVTARMQAVVSSANQQFLQIAQKDQVRDDEIKEILGRLQSLYAAMTDLYIEVYQRGEVAADYFAMKDMIMGMDDGAYMPLIIDNTGTRSFNQSIYSAIGNNRELSFTISDPAIIGILTNATAMAQVASSTNAVLMNTAVADVLAPVGAVPDSIKYTCITDNIGITSNTSPWTNLYQMVFSVVDTYGNKTNVLLKYVSGALTTMPDTPTNRLPTTTGNIQFYMATDSQPVYNKIVVRDGQVMRLYGSSGAHNFLVNFTYVANTTSPPVFTPTLSIIPLSGAAASTPLLIRALMGADFASRLNDLIIQLPLFQTNNSWLVPLVSPVSSPEGVTPPDSVEPLNLAAINLGGSGNAALFMTTFYFVRSDGLNATSATNTLLSDPESNSTLSSQFAADFTGNRKRSLGTAEGEITSTQDTKVKSRAKRSAPPVTGTFDDCYSGLDIATNYITHFSDLGTSTTGTNMQNSARTCVSKSKACSYIVIGEPLLAQMFQHDAFTMDEAYPFYYYPPRPGATEDHADYITYGGNQIPIGLAYSTNFHSIIVPPSLGAGVYINTDIPMNGLTAHCRYTDHPSCQVTFLGQNLPTSYQWPQFTFAGAGRSCSDLPYTYAINTPPDASCTFNSFGVIGNYILGGLPIWIWPISTTQRYWGACLPYEAGVVNSGVSDHYQKWLVPYFFTPGDIPQINTLGNPWIPRAVQGYGPGTDGVVDTNSYVSIQMVLPRCDTMTLTQCNSGGQAGGIRSGLCVQAFDPSTLSSYPLPITLNNVVCTNVADNPCVAGTDIDSCIAISKNVSSTFYPVCQYLLTAGSPSICQQINADAGIQLPSSAIPQTSTSTTPQNVYVACMYRPTANPWNCIFDGRCYVYMSNTMTTSLCKPLAFNASSWLEQRAFDIDLVGYTPASARNFSEKYLGINVTECGNVQAQCVARTFSATLRVQYVMTLAMNITSSGNCPNIPAGSGSGVLTPWGLTFCQQKYVYYAPSWSNPWDDATDQSSLPVFQNSYWIPNGIQPNIAYQRNSLVSYCLPNGGQCTQRCELYGKDLNGCLAAGAGASCFIDLKTLSCLTATTQNYDSVCPGYTVNTFQVGSSCIRDGNACTLLRADLTIDGAPTNYSLSDTNANLAELQNTECAKIAGYDEGSFTFQSSVSRLAGYILPSSINGACTATVQGTGPLCTQANLVTGCQTLGPACDMLANLTQSMNKLQQVEFCTYTTAAECLTATLNNRLYPCVILYSKASPTDTTQQDCLPLGVAQSKTAYSSDWGYWDRASYALANMVTHIKMTATANVFLAGNMNPASFIYNPDGAPDLYGNVVQLGPWRPTCPGNAFTKGFYCFSDADATANGGINPWHPNVVWMSEVQGMAKNSSLSAVPINTAITTACRERISALDNSTLLYACEPFVSDQGLLIFPIVNITERPKEMVKISDTDYRLMTPLKVYNNCTTCQPQGDWRDMEAPYKQTFYNTWFHFGTAFDLTSYVMPTSTTSPLGDSEVTTVQVASPADSGGIYHLSTAHFPTLLPQLLNDIDVITGVLTMLYGPQHLWYVTPDFGVMNLREPAGSDPNGNAVSKADTIIVGYTTKSFDIPISIIDSESEVAYPHTTVISNLTQTANIVKVVSFDPYLNNLPSSGQMFVKYFDPNLGKLYSAPPEEIGLNQPYKYGTLYSPVNTTNFNYVVRYNPAINANLDPRFLTKFIGNSAVTITSDDPMDGSPQSNCGSTLAGLSGADQQTLLLLDVRNILGFDTILSDSQKDYWNRQINATSATFVGFYIQFLQTEWITQGCSGQWYNSIDPGAIEDAGRLIFEACVNVADQTINEAILASQVGLYVGPANRAMCGNCILLKNTDGTYLSSFPGVNNVCDPKYGTESIPYIPQSSSINAYQASKLWDCVRSSLYISIVDHDKNLATYQSLPGFGTITVEIVLPMDNPTVYLVTDDSDCVTVLSTNSSGVVTSGSYFIEIFNAYATTIDYVYKLRLNSTSFNITPPTADTCQRDNTLSLGIGINATIAIPVCAGSFSIQFYNLKGAVCSPVLEGTLSYSAADLNATQTVLYRQSTYLDQVLNGSLSSVVDSFNKAITSVDGRIGDLETGNIVLQKSIYTALNGSVADFGALAQSIIDQNAQLLGAYQQDIAQRFQTLNLTFASITGQFVDITSSIDEISNINDGQNTLIEQVRSQINDTINEVGVVAGIAALAGPIIAEVQGNLTAAQKDIDEAKKELAIVKNQTENLGTGLGSSLLTHVQSIANSAQVNNIGILVLDVFMGLVFVALIVAIGLFSFVVKEIRSPEYQYFKKRYKEKQKEIKEQLAKEVNMVTPPPMMGQTGPPAYYPTAVPVAPAAAQFAAPAGNPISQMANSPAGQHMLQAGMKMAALTPEGRVATAAMHTLGLDPTQVAQGVINSVAGSASGRDWLPAEPTRESGESIASRYLKKD